VRPTRTVTQDSSAAARAKSKTIKKADVTEHPQVFDHAGLLVIGPPGMAGLPAI
jgi:hypothetical protein